MSKAHSSSAGGATHALEASSASASVLPPDANIPPSYEAALDELNTLVASIESGAMPLDQLLAGYQRGAWLLQFCRQRLQSVEEQIKVLDEGVLKTWKPV